MGRYNNRRRQQQALEERNVSARSRFSNWRPPNKRGRGGRGRGRGRGKDNNRAKTTDRRQNQQLQINRASVVDKIYKATQEKKKVIDRTNGLESNFLKNIDLSKVDEVKLPAEAEKTIMNILVDFGVIENNSIVDNVSDQDTFPVVDDDYDDEYATSAAVHSSTYHSDFKDEEVEEEEEESEDDEDIDNNSSNNTSKEFVSDEKDVLSHLTSYLSFQRIDAESAIYRVRNGWGSKHKESPPKSDIDGMSMLERLTLALDWLCLHLSEAELENGFQQRSQTENERISNVLRVKAIAHPSISVVRPEENYIVGSARFIGFLRLGFQYDEIVKACSAWPSESSKAPKSPLDDYALYELCRILEMNHCEDMDLSDNAKTFKGKISEHDKNFVQMEREEEISVLESIFAEDFLRVHAEEGSIHFKLNMSTIEILPPAKSDQCRLDIFCNELYPTLGSPNIFFSNPSMPPTLLREINCAIVDFVKSRVGDPVVFDLFNYLNENVCTFQQNFLNRETANKISENEETSIENGEEMPIGRRQRAKLVAEKRAFKSNEKLEQEEKDIQKANMEKVSILKAKNKFFRDDLAKEYVTNRELLMIEEEAEKAGRAAMLRELNKGGTKEEAQISSKHARDEVLRHHGMLKEMNESEDITKLAVDNCAKDDENDKIVLDSIPKATLDFMNKLRQHCIKVKEISGKIKGKDDEVSTSIFDTSEFKSKVGVNVEGHVPEPIAVKSEEMNEVILEIQAKQLQQPWLIADDARTRENKDTNSSNPAMESKKRKISQILKDELIRKLSGKERNVSIRKKFAQMLAQRKKLPSYQMKDKIVQTIRSNRVTVISGDTGCGKTTQVPAMVMDDAILRGEGSEVNIIVTQPRRISAIGVAERIAAERCEKLGDTVGYSIRLDSKRSHKTRLLLCTTGILLRRLQADPDLAVVSHVFVDEVHERDIDTDFLLIILRDLLQRRPSLKLILMSATLNADTFSSYFEGAPIVSIPGRTHPVEEYRLENVLDFIDGYRLDEGSDYALKDNAQYMSKSLLRKWFPNSNSRVHEYLKIVDESIINYELIAHLANKIATTQDEGAILVFVPGLMEITKTIDELKKFEVFTDPKRSVVYPLHSSLSNEEQAAIFQVPKNGIRKIVISTNIAETSITVEDVSYVIDTGKVKENRYDEGNQMPTLAECYASKAATKQRRGRAGRVRSGVAFHLYSSYTYSTKLRDYQVPEMLRVGLEDMILQILLLDLGQPTVFLAKAVDPPSSNAIESSLKLLENLGAIDVDWKTRKVSAVKTDSLKTSDLAANSGLTALGFHLASLPVAPKIGKLLLYGSLFGCCDTALTIASTLSTRSPFVSPFDKREEADAARKHFMIESSDPLTIVNAFNSWKRLRTGKKQFLAKSFLSSVALRQLDNMRRQLADALKGIGFLPKNYRLDINDTDSIQLVKAILCAGLYPNVIRAPLDLLKKSNSKQVSEVQFQNARGDSVHIHPSSVSFSTTTLPHRYCVYHDIVKTSKIYVRDLTPVNSFAILLFGGSLKLFHKEGVVTVDDWIIFRASAKVAAVLKHLRANMEELLLRKIIMPDEDIECTGGGRALLAAILVLFEESDHRRRKIELVAATP